MKLTLENNITITLTKEQLDDIEKQKKALEAPVWSRDSMRSDRYYLSRNLFSRLKVCATLEVEIETVYSFETRELAEQEAHIHNTMMAMRNWARFHNELDGFVADWLRPSIIKSGIYWYNSKFIILDRSTDNDFVFQISVSSRERAEQMLAEFKEDLEKIKF